MSAGADNPKRAEFLPQQRIPVDLQLSVPQLFPQYAANYSKSAEQLQQLIDTDFRNVVALPVFENNRPRLTFRSADTTNRAIVDLPEHGNLHYLVDLTRQKAHRALFLQRDQYGKASKALLYDTVLDKPAEFTPGSDDIVQYISHLEEMVAEDGYLAVQLTDSSTQEHSHKVLDALKMRFGQPAIVKQFEIVGRHPRTGALLVYRKGADAFAKPRFDTDTSEELPNGQDMADLADEFVRGFGSRRLAGTGSN